MISAVCWIPPGKAKAVPEKYNPTLEEIAALKASNPDKEDIEDADMDSEDQPMGDDDGDVAKIYGFDKYDEEEEEIAPSTMENDPMINLESDDEEDLDDLVIRPTDSLILAIEANDENDLSHLDVYVYEEDQNNLYVHHDVFLEAFPLCVAWMDYKPHSSGGSASGKSESGNLAAVGLFEPGIQIMDLDVLDAVYPVATLGGYEKQTKKTKKKKFLAGSHTDAVMGLDWNTKQRNLLASSSADKTVKVWDLATCQCVQTYTQHTDKVESVQWNPTEGAIMLCGSYDKSVTIMDVRSPASNTSLRWSVDADVEAIRWNPLSPQYFFVSCENGSVMLFDAMKGGNSAPVWTLAAHQKATSALAVNTAVPIFATGSMDKTVKIWSYAENKPTLLQELPANQHVFSLSFYNYTSPYLLSMGGDKGAVRVLNTLSYDKVAPIFGKEVIATEEATTAQEESTENNTTQQPQQQQQQDSKPKPKPKSTKNKKKNAKNKTK